MAMKPLIRSIYLLSYFLVKLKLKKFVVVLIINFNFIFIYNINIDFLSYVHLSLTSI